MKKTFFVLCLLAMIAGPAFAQRTVVSGTVKDTGGLVYSGASLTVTLSTPSGTVGAYLGGAQIAGTAGPVQLDATGSFLVQLADNTLIQCANAQGQLITCAPQTKWNFAVTLSPGVPPPLGTGPQTCSALLTITGSSQSVSSSFSACPALSAGGSAGTFLPGCSVTSGSCLGAATTPAVADWRQAATDGTCANSSTAISWGTPNEITSADVGKAIDIFSQGAGNTWQNSTRTTIAAVLTSTTATLSAVTAAAGCGSPVSFNVYTDNGPAFNGPELAIHNSAGHKGIIWYPCGTYGVATAFWNQSGANDSISYWGGGTGHSTSVFGQCTLFKVSPAILVGQNGTGLSALNPASGDMRDLVLDGQTIKLNSSNGTLLTWSGVMDVSNVQVFNFVQTPGSNGNLCIVNSNNFQARNLVCVFQDGAAMNCNSRNITVVNGYFTGSPGLGLNACYGTFTGGQVGLFASAGTNGGLNTAGGAGSVFTSFYGTQFSNGNTGFGATIITSNPSAHSVVVNLIEPNFNCQGTANVPLLSVGTTTTVQWMGRGAMPVEGTLGCGGTLPIVNNGTLHANGAGFQSAATTVSWSGAGAYFLGCDNFPVTPTISSGFGTSPSISAGASPCSFQVNVGTGGTATSGVIGLPIAPHGWTCAAVNQTTNVAVRNSAFTTSSCTLAVTTAWSASDIVSVQATPF